MGITDNVKLFLDNVKLYDLLDNKIYKFIETNNNEITVNFNVKLSNGTLKRFTGYRVQNNNTLGAYKGGLRFAPFVNLDECSALAQWMTLKCSLLELPYGGAKGGLNINLRDYSTNDIELISRGFSRALAPYIGENIDIPAPDLGTSPQIMDFMLDEYQKTTNRKEYGVFTGKSLYGSLGRTSATGNGVAYTISLLCTAINLDISETTYIIQGFGNVGSYTAKYLNQLGAKCIGVGDHTGYYLNLAGINIETLIEHNIKNGNIKDYVNTNKLEFFKTKCDIIVLAALENEVDLEIAKNVDCKIIAEGANGPITPDADKLLNKRGIQIIPDILCNSGGVTVSYFEWVQNRSGFYWSEGKVDRLLKNKMLSIFTKVFNEKPNNNMSLRESCYYFSLKNLEIASKKLGLL
jgi:glutamate dehydrogenase